MKIIWKIIAWTFDILCFLMGIVFMPSFAAFLFIAVGIIGMPIKPFQEIWKGILKRLKWLKIPILVILFYFGCFLSPTSKETLPEDSQTVQVDVSQNQENEKEEGITTTVQTTIPTKAPLIIATETPTPIIIPTETPTTAPTTIPTKTPKPTIVPTVKPTPLVTATPEAKPTDTPVIINTFSLASIPAFSSEPYLIVNDNVPYFADSELINTAFENYSELDSLGRCGVAYANICKEIMPTEERGAIGSVKPSGWQSVKYDNVDGKYLYNRCHLIGFQLAGENANTKNLITGTRYLNIEGMLPFENMVDDYVEETGNHVLYRVTPIFEGDNLLAAGVLMEAKSVEDKGEGILFNVFCYNAQPGISIDYANGNSAINGEAITTPSAPEKTKEPVVTTPAPTLAPTSAPVTDNSSEVTVHITDTGKKYHSAGCSSLSKSDHEVTLEKAKGMGLTPCSKCNPPS